MKSVILAILTLVFSSQLFSQELSALDRRLFVAVSGYELHETEAKSLLNQGANINAVNGAMGGETFLINDIKSFKEPGFIKFLLDNGADPNIKDASGRTALSYAQQYNIGKNNDGKAILNMLMKAMNIRNETNETKDKPVVQGNPKQNNTKPAKPASKSGAPTPAEVKQTMEKSFTGIYQNHFFGVINKVSFEWSGVITIGQIQKVRAAPSACYPVKLQVRVTATDPRDGNTSVSDRGQNARIGGYVKNEIFCFYRNGFGEWEYGTYEQ